MVNRADPGSWGENKLRRTINLTDTAWNLLQEEADRLDISKSELLERIARGEHQLNLDQRSVLSGESWTN